MNPWISITSYLIHLFIIFVLTNICLIDVFPEKLKRRRIEVFYMPVVFLIGLLPVAGAMMPDSPLKFRLQAWGNIWLGFLIYYDMLLIVLLLLRLIISLIVNISSKGRKKLRGLGVILAVSFIGGAGLLIYGMIHAQDTKLVTYDVEIDKDAGDLKEMKIVLIADLHICVNSNFKMIQNMVDMVNAQEADLVVVPGDIFTSSYGGMQDPDRYAEILRGIRSKYGVYAVYGNHDVEETLFGGFPITPISKAFRTPEMEQFFKDAGFTVLYDEMTTIEDSIQLVGRIDGEKAGDGTANRMTAAELLKDIDPEKPVVVLEHEPVDYANLSDSGADLILSGHTHAGQIFPGNLIIPYFNENAYGYKVISGTQTIVTAGIGYYGPPMRVGTNSEVNVVNVKFKD